MQRGLAPYLASALLILVGSVATLTGALAAGGLLEERAPVDDAPAPSAARAPVELSRAGRLAYWRADPKGGYQLWVANLDGANRRALARTTVMSSIETMRWSPDGNALAFIDRAHLSVAVVRLDGTQIELRLDASVVPLDSRLSGLAWSTDGRQLAATVRSPSGTASDVYVAPASGGGWRNVTGLGDAFLSQWISPTELLIHTQGGTIAVQRADGPGLTPLTSLGATSPFLGDDGRVYFLAGQIAPTIRDNTLPVVNASQARVWSTTIGGEPRAETTQRYDDIRLVGRWPNGPFIASQGASTALSFLGTAGIPPIDQRIGIVERLVFSPDRRTAIGLTFGRIDRYDTARPESPVVLLSDVFQPDAWYPNPAPVAARATATPSGRPVPSARLTFAMHGSVWVTDARGNVQLVAKLGSDDRSLRRLGGSAIPQWSPKGDRILYFDVLPSSVRGMAYVADLAGAVRRVNIADASAVGPFPTWTPEGNVAYTATIVTSDPASFDADAEIRIVSPNSVATLTTQRGREIAFGGGKTYLIDNGQQSVPLQTRVGHAVVEVAGASRRTITTAAQLGTDPRGGTGLQLSALGISADASTLSVRVSPATGASGFLSVFFRATDGAPTLVLPGESVSDVRWAPKGHLVGLTLGRPIVRDAETGVIVATVGEGRFAGWSPDGEWFYVAREAGLYAVPLGGGDPVWISALGVPVSATTP